MLIVRTAAVDSVTFNCWYAWHKSIKEKMVPSLRFDRTLSDVGSGSLDFFDAAFTVLL